MKFLLHSKINRKQPKKWVELKQSKQSHICGLHHVRVNGDVKNPRLVSTDNPFVIFRFCFPFYCKKIVNKNVSQSSFNFINTQSTHSFLIKILKKRSQFHCTGLLRSSKLVHIDSKNLICFFQNLVHNLMNLVLHSKIERKQAKNGYN